MNIGFLEISNVSAIFLLVVSLLFLGSFILVSLKNDNEGMMRWIFEKSKNE
tara:strand:+ start:388 stop:540 length:153 start_codon:yes stop_codon:yes gene_type:complete